MKLKNIAPEELITNPFADIGKRWMLITAAHGGRFNTMTASWGSLGIIWGVPAATVVVRPTRHTFAFMEKADSFTLSFFPETCRTALNYCGTHSGRDVDKCKETGLIPVWDGEDVWFDAADMVLRCRKLYAQDMDPACFADPSQDSKFYPNKDYHRMYIGEITAAMQSIDA